MVGYTPVFDSVYAGTLCGRWPATAVWVTLLPLCDKHGHIDLSYQAICALTGWPLDLLRLGITELMQPDPHSRSAAEEGRRLVLLDPEHRNWGWRVVNHSLYREKARKLQYDNERTASGADAARKRAQREMSRDTPTCPDVSREVPLSDADADSYTDASKRGDAHKCAPDAHPKTAKTATARARGGRLPEDFTLTEQRRAIAVAEGVEPERTFAKFSDYWLASTGRNATKRDWDAAWRNWCRSEHDRSPRPNGAAKPDAPVRRWRPTDDEAADAGQ